MAQRTPNDLCLLCRESNATKKNSHIIPKFLAKPILGEGQQKTSYTINPRGSRVVSKKEQDSPKEDYILCPVCEKYFAGLETYMSKKIFTKIGTAKEEGDSRFVRDEGGKEAIYFEGVDSHIVHLFFVSILWRCSNSSIAPFQGFEIPDSEQFRVYLRNGMKDKTKEKAENDIRIAEFPIIVFKVKTQHNHTSNLIYTVGGTNTGLWQVMVDDLLFWYGKPETPIIQAFKSAWVLNNGKFIITLLDNEFWQQLTHNLLQQAANLTKMIAAR